MQPTTLVCSSPPGSRATQGASPLNMSSLNRVRNRISPIQMKSGSAVSVQSDSTGNHCSAHGTRPIVERARSVRFGQTLRCRWNALDDDMKLWALSDLHLSHAPNREALGTLPAHPDDWLLPAGDVTDGFRHLEWCFDTLNRNFGQLVWVPGNHELWTRSRGASVQRGAALYAKLVEIARRHVDRRRSVPGSLSRLSASVGPWARDWSLPPRGGSGAGPRIS